ncbi:MAG: DUF4080 domain-containing protein, partial [Granulosicoccaceae bacterium]
MCNINITLTTLNARYSHAALGLRYLKANLGEYQDKCSILEFTLQARPLDVVEALLASSPTIVGFSVYIWNRNETLAVLQALKIVAPNVVVVVGGPEVSHGNEEDPISALADHTIRGWGELSFLALCQAVDRNEAQHWPKLIDGVKAPMDTIALPYQLYEEDDIAHRNLYVEASRGCPFKCEFCLSALDETAWPFPLQGVLQSLADLYDRGARNFRFVDRTFNLRTDVSGAILDFFLERLAEPLSLHFELVPDKLPEKLREKIARFPPGVLQLEVGIQSFDPDVQARISRRQNNQKAKDNLRWLRQHTHAHLHTDLIFGLPGEDIDSFAKSFDTLVELNPQEIQLGILKLLPGAPIARHNQPHAMLFDSAPPYRVLQTDCADFSTVQRVDRMARHWDLIANSGRFQHSLAMILGDSPFERFLALSEWLHQNTGSARGLSPTKLFRLLKNDSELPIDLQPEQYAFSLSK